MRSYLSQWPSQQLATQVQMVHKLTRNKKKREKNILPRDVCTCDIRNARSFCVSADDSWLTVPLCDFFCLVIILVLSSRCLATTYIWMHVHVRRSCKACTLSKQTSCCLRAGKTDIKFLTTLNPRGVSSSYCSTYNIHFSCIRVPI